MKHLTDDQLMEFIINGQTNYMTELYSRYKQELFGFFYHLTHQPALSEDLVQNVFVRLLKYYHTYTLNDRFRSWLYQLARNAHIDMRRTNQQRFQSGFETLDEADHEKLSAENSQVDDRLNLINKALLQLDPEKQELLILHRFQKLTYAEIAELHHSNEGAIKVRMFRIISELRDICQNLESEQA